jgi:hypothetical protein
MAPSEYDNKLSKNTIISPIHNETKLNGSKAFKNGLFNSENFFNFNRNKTPNNRTTKREPSEPLVSKIKSKSITNDKSTVNYNTNSIYNGKITNTNKQLNFTINKWNKNSTKKKQLTTNEAVKSTATSTNNKGGPLFSYNLVEKIKRKDNDVKLTKKENRPRSLNLLRSSSNNKL